MNKNKLIAEILFRIRISGINNSEYSEKKLEKLSNRKLNDILFNLISLEFSGVHNFSAAELNI